MTDAKTLPPQPTFDRKVIALAAGLFLVGWLIGREVGDSWIPSPFAPEKDRPVLRFLSKVARLGLWVMMAAEKPPADEGLHYAHVVNPNRLNHREGW